MKAGVSFLTQKTTTGARRGEMCALRWSDWIRRTGEKSVLSIARSIFVLHGGGLEEKDTKTHQKRHVVLEPEEDAILADQEQRARARAECASIPFDPNGFIYSPLPDGSLPRHPDTVTKQYAKLVKRLGITTNLKNHRHYNATELINAGYNVRAAAGQLGHSGGGTTTLRVYTAWWSEAEQKAAGATPTRVPAKPESHLAADIESVRVPSPMDEDLTLYQRIAADLRGAINCGVLAPGDTLPTEKALARRYGVAPSTAHRAIALLVSAGIATATLGHWVRVTDTNASGSDSLASVTAIATDGR
ncbi:GntR family transcriptional regulator [Kribbella sp. NPDC051587]|uniref:GntR family transcriptional regulator n=1 Tax=Kribbella sp. NPDC051587 TaxID=3364119 RepID=UPI0037B6D544